MEFKIINQSKSQRMVNLIWIFAAKEINDFESYDTVLLTFGAS